jgi:tryptophan 7-halogenase
MAAAQLIHLVKELGVPFGLERSLKIMQGTLDGERFLLSVGRAAFGDRAERRLLEMSRALNIPQEFADRFASSLEGADVLHFGYEASHGRAIYKIYFEYASTVRQAMTLNAAPTLVHLAYKWDSAEPNNSAVTRYTWIPCRTAEDLQRKLHSLVPVTEAPNASRCMSGLVSKVAASVDLRELLLMEVDEPGYPRRSCDINVYDAEMRVHQIADLVETAAAGMSAPVSEVNAVLKEAANKALGHFSAGLGRSGREFVTIYFGVEAH